MLSEVVEGFNSKLDDKLKQSLEDMEVICKYKKNKK